MTEAIDFKNFEDTVDQNEMVILDFWAAWCGPCEAFGPLFEEMSEKHQDVFFGKVDVDQAKDLAEAFRVRSIPTLMAFKKGELVYEQAGILPPAQFEELLDKLRALEIQAQQGTGDDPNAASDVDPNLGASDELDDPTEIDS